MTTIKNVLVHIHSAILPLSNAIQNQYGILLAIGLITSNLLLVSPVAALFMFCICSFPLLLVVSRTPRILLSCSLIIGSLQSIWLSFTPPLPSPSIISDQGVITSLTSKHSRLTLDVTTDAFKLKLLIPPGAIENVKSGDSIYFTAKRIPITRASNPGQFDYHSYLYSNGIIGMYKADSTTLQIHQHTSATGILGSVQASISSTIDEQFSLAASPLLKALLLGNKTDLSHTTKKQFRETGLYHVLAISGLHIGIIILLLQTLFSLIRLPHKVVYLLSLTTLWLYAGVVGFPPSVIRAGVMYSVLALSWTFERKSRSLNSLGIAISLILLCAPSQILDIGFQLSALATFFILYFSSIFLHKLPKKWWSSFLVTPVLVTIFATAGTAPILINNFNSIAPAALIGNIITVPLITLSLISGIISLGVFPLTNYLAGIFADATNLLSDCTLWIVSQLHAVSGPPIHISPVPIIILAVYLLIIVVLPRINVNRAIRSILLFTLLCSSSSYVLFEIKQYVQSAHNLTVIDVGTGEAILVESSNGKTLLVDTGYDSPKVSDYALLPFLNYQGIDHIDVILITHLHRDHYGNLSKILRAYSVGRVIMGRQSSLSPDADTQDHPWNKTKMLIDSLSIPLHRVNAGDSIHGFGELNLAILHPGPIQYSNENNNSIVLSLEYGSETILLTGDIEKEVESYLCEQNLLRDIDVLKTPHHGSKTSSTIPFLNQTKPEQIVISAGTKKRYNHPSPEIIKRFSSRNIEWDATRYHGAISMQMYRDTTIITPYTLTKSIE